MQESACQANEMLQLSFPYDDNGIPIYPDDYAGTYIDWSRDASLVVLLVNADDTRRAEYLQRCRNSDVVLFGDAEFGWNDLCKCGNSCINYLIENGILVYCGSLNIAENSFSIEVEIDNFENAESMIETLKQEPFVSSNPAISHVKVLVGTPIIQLASIYGGNSITNNSTNVSCAVGIGGGYLTPSSDYTNCLVTCGHGNPYSSSVKFNGSITGSVVYRSYSTNYSSPSVGDYSIILLSSNTAKKQIQTGNSYVSITSLQSPMFPQGGTYIKYGPIGGIAVCTTTAYCNYAVTTSNGSGGNGYVTGVWASSLSGGTAYLGDSGGPIYTGNTLVGLTTAMNGLGVFYFTPIGLATNVGFYI